MHVVGNTCGTYICSIPRIVILWKGVISAWKGGIFVQLKTGPFRRPYLTLTLRPQSWVFGPARTHCVLSQCPCRRVLWLISATSIRFLSGESVARLTSFLSFSNSYPSRYRKKLCTQTSTNLFIHSTTFYSDSKVKNTKF